MSYCCTFSDCGCKIIKVDTTPIVKLPSNVLDKFHLMQKGKDQHKDQEIDGYSNFLLINDVWDFDNIGVSKEIPTTSEILDHIEFEYGNEKWEINKHLKYLVCADCDRGPIGIVCSIKCDGQMKTVYLLSLPSVSQI